eukprot:3744720-Pyramimonas_sp.AAC.1
MKKRKLVTVSSADLMRVAVPRGSIDMGRMCDQLASENMPARDRHRGGRCQTLCSAQDSRANNTFGVGYSCCTYPMTVS